MRSDRPHTSTHTGSMAQPQGYPRLAAVALLALAACGLASCESSRHHPPDKSASHTATENLAYPKEDAAWSDTDKKSQAESAHALVANLAAAIAAGKNEFTIPPGVYRFGTFGGPANLTLADLRGFTLKADGALFYYNGRVGCDAVAMKNCHGVTLRGLSLDCDPLSTSQGQIVELDRSAKILKIRVDPGFPLPVDWLPHGSIKAVFFAPDGTARGTLYETVTSLKQAEDDPRVFTVGVSANFLFTHENGVCLGDRMALPERRVRGRGVVQFGGGGNILERVTIYAAPDISLAELGGDGDNLYTKCVVTRRPGTKRLIASNADIFRSIKMRKGPRVEECDFGYTADDILNIHSYASMVWQVRGPDELVVVESFTPELQPGTDVTLVSHTRNTMAETAKVVSVSQISDQETIKKAAGIPADVRRQGGHMIDFVGKVWVSVVKFDRELQVQEYDTVFSYERCGVGATIRRNYFHDSAVASGIHYKGRDAIFEDNRIERIGSSAILVASNIFFLEGPNSANLLIRNNRIIDCGFTLVGRLWPNGYHASIAVYTGGPRNSVATTGINNRKIRIEHNVITRPGAVGILLSNSEDCAIIGNQIISPASKPLLEQATTPFVENLYAIYLANCRQVELRANTMQTPTTACRGLLGFGPEVTACGPQDPSSK